MARRVLSRPSPIPGRTEVLQLMGMGFAREKAETVLQQTDDIEAAIEVSEEGSGRVGVAKA